MKTRYPHLAAKVFDTPLLIHPDKARVYGDYVARRCVGMSPEHAQEALTALGVQIPDAVAQLDEDTRRRFGTRVTPEGIAIVPVDGVLVQKTLGMRPWSGQRAYEDLAESIMDVATDPSVRGILLDIDSPGGEVSGLPDLGDVILEAGQVKPIWAVANDFAYSAAYWIAAPAEQIYVSRTSGIGSVGVITVHWEASQALEAEGIRVNVIRFGARKAEANRFEELSDQAAAALQAEVDRLGEMFVAWVAEQRDMDPDDVRGTEAGTFHGPNGIDVGFADQVGTLEDAHAALVARVQNGASNISTTLRGAAAHHPSPQEDTMGTKTDEKPAGQTEQAGDSGTQEPAGAGGGQRVQTEVLDLEKHTAEARMKERAYQKEVRQLCQLAGKPELADEFIEAELSVDTVRQKLVDARAQESEADEIAGQHEGRASVPDRPPVDLAAVHEDSFSRYRKAAGTAVAS